MDERTLYSTACSVRRQAGYGSVVCMIIILQN